MRYLLALLLLAAPAFAQDPCGPDTPCEIEEGSYHLSLPAGWQTADALPVLMFYHGHNATGGLVYRSGGLQSDFVDQGYAVIAPNGTPISGRNTRRWAGREGGVRDDVAFSLAVLEDAATRVPLDLTRVYAAGFSAGGSMVWLLACKQAQVFAGFASVSGALRQPNSTDDCPSDPVRFLHIHGFADNQVPFEGRAIRDWHQGSVWDSLSLARTANQCRSHPDRIELGDRFDCRMWDTSCAGGAVTFCTHDGGHGLPRGWTTMARDWFEAG